MGLDKIINLATFIVFYRFQDAINNYESYIKNQHVLFNLANLVCDELIEKNGDLFFDNYFDKFHDTKDIL